MLSQLCATWVRWDGMWVCMNAFARASCHSNRPSHLAPLLGSLLHCPAPGSHIYIVSGLPVHGQVHPSSSADSSRRGAWPIVFACGPPAAGGPAPTAGWSAGLAEAP